MDEDALLARVLREARTVAVVGLSDDPSRPSNGVARYLQANGYRIVPVNPGRARILGETCYPDLASVPVQVDVVDVFRRPEHCAGVAREAVRIGAKVLWLQLGVVSEEARRIAEATGLTVVMDRCMKIEHARLIG